MGDTGDPMGLMRLAWAVVLALSFLGSCARRHDSIVAHPLMVQIGSTSIVVYSNAGAPLSRKLEVRCEARSVAVRGLFACVQKPNIAVSAANIRLIRLSDGKSFGSDWSAPIGIRAVAIAPDLSMVSVLGFGRESYGIYNIDLNSHSLRLVSSISFQPTETESGSSIEWSADQQRFAVSDQGRGYIIRASDGLLLSSFAGEDLRFAGSPDLVSFHLRGEMGIRLYSLLDGSFSKGLTEHEVTGPVEQTVDGRYRVFRVKKPWYQCFGYSQSAVVDNVKHVTGFVCNGYGSPLQWASGS